MKSQKVIIATTASASLLLLLLVLFAALVVFHYNGDDAIRTVGESSSDGMHAGSKAIEEMCSATDYKSVCQSSLSYAMRETDFSDVEPKDLMKAATAVIVEELVEVSNRSKYLDTEDPMVRGAIDDCKELFHHAKHELRRTIHVMDSHGLEEIPKNSHELKNWLSAVISYQQTCVDGFPEGELKTKMDSIVTSSKHMSSNALAIVSEVTSIVAGLDVEGPTLRRRLLSSTLDGRGRIIRSWALDGDRRMLLDKAAQRLKPDVMVAKDGSGNFTTITDAIAAIPKKRDGRFVIYVREGVYDESPMLRAANVTMYGDGSRKTIVTGGKNLADGVRTFHTATFAAVGEGFTAIGMTFRNTAGAVKHEAVALRVQSDRAIFLNCRMEGYQNTLYAQTHRQFYRSCVISGTINFIFGDAAAVFQNCVLVLRKPLNNQKNIVTAQGRTDRRESTGYVLQRCRFEAERNLKAEVRKRSYLARPSHKYSRTIIMESEIGGFVHPAGYLPWDGDFALDTLYYGEYDNKGDGAKLDERVAWAGFKAMKEKEAKKYTAAAFIQGDEWLRERRCPVHLGLYNI